MIYVKFNYNGAWFFYGPWRDVAVHYGCVRRDQVDGPTLFAHASGEVIVDEIFKMDVGLDIPDQLPKSLSTYNLITGWEDGKYKAIALNGCKAYLLTAEGKTLERI